MQPTPVAFRKTKMFAFIGPLLALTAAALGFLGLLGTSGEIFVASMWIVVALAPLCLIQALFVAGKLKLVPILTAVIILALAAVPFKNYLEVQRTGKPAVEFGKDVSSGAYEKAYQMMSPDYQKTVSFEKFETFMKTYLQPNTANQTPSYRDQGPQMLGDQSVMVVNYKDDLYLNLINDEQGFADFAIEPCTVSAPTTNKNLQNLGLSSEFKSPITSLPFVVPATSKSEVSATCNATSIAYAISFKDGVTGRDFGSIVIEVGRPFYSVARIFEKNTDSSYSHVTSQMTIANLPATKSTWTPQKTYSQEYTSEYTVEANNIPYTILTRAYGDKTTASTKTEIEQDLAKLDQIVQNIKFSE